MQRFSHYPGLPPPVRVSLTTLMPHPCPYLPGRVARSRAFFASDLDPEVYQQFMDAGFRRSGRLIYQPVCDGCRECRQIRLDVARFRSGKSHRRCLRRNHDLVSRVTSPQATAEKYDLFARYVTQWHGQPLPSQQELIEFLYDSPVETIEIEHRLAGGKLVGVGICDLSARVVSSVYYYFDPDFAHRGLGTYGALYEIDLTRRIERKFYYLGYWIRDCPAMAYKAQFRPAQLLATDGHWADAEALTQPEEASHEEKVLSHARRD